MKFLRRILAKVKKLAFTNKSFNLNKIAREVHIDEYGTDALTSEQQDLVSNVLRSLTPEEQTEFVDGRRTVTISDTQETVRPIETTSTDVPQINEKAIMDALLKDKDLASWIIRQKNYSVIDPGEASNLEEKSIEYVTREYRVPQSKAAEFVNALLNMSSESIEESISGHEREKKEKAKQRILDPSDPGFLTTKFMRSKFVNEEGLSLYDKISKVIKEEEDIRGEGYDPAAIRDWVIDRRLGPPPERVGGKGGLNQDYRASYFFHNPDSFPIQKFQDPNDERVVAIKKLLVEKYGRNPDADFVKEILPSFRHGEATTFSNELMSIAGDDIITELSNQIDTNPENIIKWVLHGREAAPKQKKEFTGMLGGEDPDDQVMQIEDVGKSEKIMTPEEEAVYNQEVGRISDEEVGPMLKAFSEEYLTGIISNTQDVGRLVFDSLIEDAKNKDMKKRPRIEDQADRLLMYLNTATGQIKDFFSGRTADGKQFTPKFDPKAGGEGISYQHPNKSRYNIKIPGEPLQELKRNLLRDTGSGILGHIDRNGRLSDEAKAAIQKTIKDGNPDWTPDWRTWVRPKELNARLNKVGEIKVNIKKIYEALRKNNPKVNPDDVYKALRDDNKKVLANIYNGVGDITADVEIDPVAYKYITGFIDRTDRQPLKGQFSIESNWLYAGRYDTPIDMGTSDAAKKSHIESIQNNESLTSKEKAYQIDRIEKSWGGLKNPKHSFLTDVKQYFKHMGKLKEFYGPTTFRSFFNLIEPDSSILTGKGKKGRGKDEYKDTDYTSMYYGLVGTDAIKDPYTRLKVENSVSARKEQSDKIENDPTKGRDYKAYSLHNLDRKWKDIDQAMELAERLRLAKGRKKVLDNAYDLADFEMGQAIKRALKIHNQEMDKNFKEEHGKPPRGRQKSIETDHRKIIEWDKKNKKRYTDAALKKREIQERRDGTWFDEKKNSMPESPDKEVAQIEKKIKNKRESSFFIKNDDALNKLFSQANSSSFRMMYSMYKRDTDSMKSLFAIADQHNSMKLASGSNSMTIDMIKSTIEKYENLLGLN